MAAGISFSGLGSGIDFGKITDSIIAQRSRPLNQLQSQKSSINDRVKSLTELNTGLASLTSAAKALQDSTLGTNRTAHSSAASILTASSNDTAALGTLNVEVTRVATAYSEASGSLSSETAAVLADSAIPATFVLRKDGTTDSETITINADNNSLEALRDAINAATIDGEKIGVTASIVDIGDGSGFKLVLNSTQTGTANRVQLIETTGPPATVPALAMSALNPPAGRDASELNASLKINGLEIFRPSNTITDAVSGVTFTLKDKGTASVNIEATPAALTDAISSFVKAYNTIQDAINVQYKADASGRPQGVLAGDSMLRSIQQQMRDAVNRSISNGGTFNNLAEIGIGRDDAGKLTIDTTIFNEKIAKSPEDVRALFSGKAEGETGLAHTIYKIYDSLSSTSSGSIQLTINTYNSSIKRIDDSINLQQERIEALRISLTRQFAAADKAISQLNGQGTTLTSMLDSLKPKN